MCLTCVIDPNWLFPGFLPSARFLWSLHTTKFQFLWVLGVFCQKKVALRVCLCVDPYVCACLEPTRAVGAEQGFMMKFRSNEVFAKAKWEKMGKKGGKGERGNKGKRG